MWISGLKGLTRKFGTFGFTVNSASGTSTSVVASAEDVNP